MMGMVRTTNDILVVCEISLFNIYISVSHFSCDNFRR